MDATVAAAVSTVAKEVTGGAKRGHWPCGGEEAQNASMVSKPASPRFGVHPSAGRSRYGGGRQMLRVSEFRSL